MRVSISNIAWDPAEDRAVAALLARLGVDAIDVAPGKYFPDPLLADDAAIARVRDAWAAQGIGIVGMQALLFGASGLNLFGPAEVRERMLARLDAVCRIGAGLGARHLTFGSPRNRDRSGFDEAAANSRAVEFFTALGARAAQHGVVVCLEPNPPRYGANFMTDLASTVAVVEAVAHPAIRLQLDAGALTIERLAAADALARCAPLVGHVHASEPDLVPLGDGGTDHAALGAALRAARPDLTVTVEMLAPQGDAPLVTLERALALALSCYGPAAEARR